MKAPAHVPRRTGRPAAWAPATVLVAALLAAPPALAGRTCEAKRPTAEAVRQAMDLAAKTATALDATGAQVVVLARAGQDLSRHGLRWSHLGLAYRDAAGWRIVHKLNHCGSARADLYRQGLGEFFLDDPHQYRAGWVVPRADVQAALRPLLADNARVAALHQSAYNMVAYPWSQRYQQSNQWAIETLAMAQSPAATTRERAQAWLKLNDYQPTVLRLSTTERLGARVTTANIEFDDHPGDERFRGRIATITVDSVFAWLQRSGLGGPAQELGL